MTLQSPQVRSPSERKRPRRPISEFDLSKPVTPDDVARLHELAERLGGRPVPGVRMTERQFEEWCDPDVKAEWVDGEIILMSPENLETVDLGGWLNALLREFVEHHDLGKLNGRDFMVRLPNQRRRRVPDLIFLEKDRLGLLKPTYLDGAPDLVIELVSSDSQTRDRRDKYGEYQRAGVKEYWIIDPGSRHAEAYTLGKNKRFQRIDVIDGKLNSALLSGFHLRFDWLRRAKLPTVAKTLRELGVRR